MSGSSEPITIEQERWATWVNLRSSSGGSVMFDSWSEFREQLSETRGIELVEKSPRESVYCVVYAVRDEEQYGVSDYRSKWIIDRDSLYFSQLKAEQYGREQVNGEYGRNWTVQEVEALR